MTNERAQKNIKEGKTTAIIAYLTIFGTVAAYVMNFNKKNTFASFHIRQMIGIVLLGMINKYLVFDFFGRFIGGIFFLGLVIIWLIAFFGVLREEKKKVPFFGEYFQRWFRGI